MGEGISQLKSNNSHKREFAINIDDIKRGLNKEEFLINYQPLVSKENEIIGVEALARWISKEHGFVPPDVFIPIIEENEFIYEFQNYILETACNHIRYLNENSKKELRLSVNISPKQLESMKFTNDIRAIINRSKIEASVLEFEMTESYPISDFEKVKYNLKMIKEMNITLSLDDFGTGYNSIKYLYDFEFDTVKIDKSYIDNVTDNPNFICSMINMIHSVGSRVVSEGVEHKQQAEVLKNLKCDILQGYYYYKPVGFNELLNIIQTV